MEEEEEIIVNRIQKFYDGRSVFITGATGFVGKVLVEKLLRSCSGIDRIYMLIRPSREKSVIIRMQEFVNNQVFDRVRKTDDGFFKKLVAVEGDVTLPGFGISSDDMQLLIDNVSIVFHSAATVRFDEDLKNAIKMNVEGPRRMLEICKQMKQLKAFVHVSTAYCNVQHEQVEERIYTNLNNQDPCKLIEMISCFPDELINTWTPNLIGSYPNTYTFTKNLAENILEKERENVPLVIVRPSIVTASLREPFPGWIDNYNGPTGIMTGIGKGLIRSLKCDKEAISDLIPVDLVINLMLTVAWKKSLKKCGGEVQVYHSSTGSLENRLTWGTFTQLVVDSWRAAPCSKKIRTPAATLHTRELHYKVHRAIFHSIPGYLMDLPMKLNGKRGTWMKLYDKIHKTSRALEYFATHQWRFISQNMEELLRKMSETEREMFYMGHIDWRTYVNNYTLGIRNYLLKEGNQQSQNNKAVPNAVSIESQMNSSMVAVRSV